MMFRLRAVALAEVLRATPADEATQRIATQQEPWGLWRFDAAAVAIVTGQLQNGILGTLGVLAPEWRAWLAAPNSSDAAKDLRSHQFFLSELRAGRSLGEPVLYFAPGHTPPTPRHILDGRHRLFAVLDFATEMPGFQLDVFWSDAGSGLKAPS